MKIVLTAPFVSGESEDGIGSLSTDPTSSNSQSKIAARAPHFMQMQLFALERFGACALVRRVMGQFRRFAFVMATMDLVFLSDVEWQLDPFMQCCCGTIVRYMESRPIYMELGGSYIVIYVSWLLQRSYLSVAVTGQYNCITVVRESPASSSFVSLLRPHFIEQSLLQKHLFPHSTCPKLISLRKLRIPVSYPPLPTRQWTTSKNPRLSSRS